MAAGVYRFAVVSFMLKVTQNTARVFYSWGGKVLKLKTWLTKTDGSVGTFYIERCVCRDGALPAFIRRVFGK